MNLFRLLSAVLLLSLLSCFETEVHMTEGEIMLRDSLIRLELAHLREVMADSCEKLKEREVPLLIDSLKEDFYKDIQQLKQRNTGG